MKDVENWAIQAHGLRHRYGETVALDGVDLRLPTGGFLALLGPNGAGKTTLVHLLCTLLALQEGEAWVGGYSVRQAPQRVRQVLGLVFQEPSLDERLTLYENLWFHAQLYGVPSWQRQKRIQEAIELTELSEWVHSPVRAFSRGMKRRAEVGRAVLHRPRLLVLDEPTVGLDVQSRRRIWEYLEGLRAGLGVGLLLTTHQLEEAERASEVAILDRGRILSQGSPAQLKERHGGPTVVLQLSDPALVEDLLRRFPQAKRLGSELRLPMSAPGPFLAEFMPQHGAKLHGLQVVYPGLEEVFVALTGRALREEAGR